MKKRKILIILATCIFLISCNDEIPQFAKKNVALASGVTFHRDSTNKNLKDNKVVVVDSFTGEKAQSCGDVIVLDEHYGKRSEKSLKQSYQLCNNQILSQDERLLNALKSNEPIEGKIKKDNGEEVPAVFYVSVTALYFGSHCSTLYHGGKAYTKCVKQEQESPF
jgi:hypothetical protein